MKQNFWEKLKKPIMAIAPMANVTDAAFRQMLLKYGRPDIFLTEFVSVEGLTSKGKEQLLVDLWYNKKEHPIVAQIFGAKPEKFEKAAEIIRELGFDGIDINMGCPDKDIEKQGAGAALIKNPELAKQIIRATKKGAGDLPISVKTRIGYSKNQIKEWIPILLKENLAALTVHLRTKKEGYNIAAHWELAPEIAALRDCYASETIILGNGDINTLDEAREKTKKSGLDGVMVGRGILANPWLFSKKMLRIQERLECMVKHVELFEKMYKTDSDKNLKSFNTIKKYFKAYISGFDNAKDLRVLLMGAKNAIEVKKITKKFIKETNIF
ncbi:MAG: tRNA-dihydrouridine synthase [Patescibacteria group bacterium]|nr:tRNA-dihydrouridine synthase [Patescibacteria group bacterium]MDD5164015.1 tRNA-dihydrouridine synthase [Patescibacteria group bacterium]MDD5534901.1 tRNA-dihydrouridine synthase [Patescibacteria group bacterium]